MIMENDDLNDIRVVVSLNEIEFLNLEDVVSQQERTFLLSCLKSSPDTRLPGAPGRPWQTPRREQQSVDLDFGSATEVFHSLQSGVSLDHDEAGGVGGGPGVGGQPQQSHISLPPYMAGIPLPGSCHQSGAQHIHINNFTANLNFPAAAAGHPAGVAVSTQSGPVSLPTQPLPFTVGYPSSGPYVAPFRQPSPPVYQHPGHIMVYQPPLHVSMYHPQPQYQQQPPAHQDQDHKEATPTIMFGSTPVVSVRHSSSDEETAEEPSKRPINSGNRASCETPPRVGHQEFTVNKGQTDVGSTNVRGQAHETSRNDKASVKSSVTTAEEDQGPKSWASLFTPSASSLSSLVSQGDKPTARITPFTPTAGPGLAASSSVLASVSKEDRELSEYLRSYSLQHIAPAFLPRGLTNRSNWCFVNAILQALLACPPFYNLMKSLPTVGGLKSGKSSTPMIDSVVEFVNEMAPLETMNKNQKKDKARKKEDLPTGNPLEPSYVYKTLLQLESETFKVVEGRQEDAEEFLTCLLNMISDEMLALLKITLEDDPCEQEHDTVAGGQGGDWQEVAARGRSQVTRRITDQNNIVTPLQQLALGLCRYSVKSATNESSATLQPFYTLQLDIQSENIKSVDDALMENFASEQLDGYICSKTNKQVEASKNLSLEELPPILILHLKRFVYSGTSGGCQKVMKPVEFSVDLEISRELLSVASKSKYTTKQRQYKLFAVVYHTGREATKGHYVADVYHTGYASWLHCDDSIVQLTAEQLVTAPQPNYTPYILFYRRGDTMIGVEKTVK